MKVLNRQALGVKFYTTYGPVEVLGYKNSLIIGAKSMVTEIADEAWREIKAKYAHIPEIKEGIIFADEKIENVEAFAKEMADEKLNDEPLDPEDLKNIKPKKGK